MNEFRAVISDLEDYDIDYWVDSGSLLGIIRNGELLETDLDIDITVWHREIKNIQEFLKEVETKGYHIKKKLYSGTPYGFSLTPPPDSNRSRKLDIKILSQHGDYGWTPARNLTLKNPYTSLDPRYYFNGVPRHILSMFNKRVSSMDMDSVPWKLFYDFRTYVVPEDLVSDFTNYGEFGCRIPKNVDEYLTYRYGDWEVPVTEWEWWYDDGAVKEIHPKDFLSYNDAQLETADL